MSAIPSLSELLKQHKCLKLKSTKVQCKATGHEMAANAEVVFAYVNGKKFKKETQWLTYDFSKFLPHIVPDGDEEKYLRCKLTNTRLNKIPDQIKAHINGKNFLSLKKDFDDAEAAVQKRKLDFLERLKKQAENKGKGLVKSKSQKKRDLNGNKKEVTQNESDNNDDEDDEENVSGEDSEEEEGDDDEDEEEGENSESDNEVDDNASVSSAENAPQKKKKLNSADKKKQQFLKNKNLAAKKKDYMRKMNLAKKRPTK